MSPSLDRRLVAGLLVAAILTPALASAGEMSMAHKEQLVEGHTIFHFFDPWLMAWTVAGLVSELAPRVLWFNDEYLVGETSRYPCGGWVLAVLEGRPSPLVETDFLALGARPATLDYEESYRVKDPNDFTWVIDVYAYSGGPVWVASVLNSDIPDDGESSCQPIVDSPPGPTVGPPGSSDGYLDPGLNARCYSGGQYHDDGTQRCGPPTPDCPGIEEPFPDTGDFDGDGTSAPPGSSPVVYTTPNGLTPICDWPRLYNFLLFGSWDDVLDARDGDSKEHGCGDGDDDGDVECVEGNPDFGADNEDKTGCDEGPYDPRTIEYDCMDEDGDPSGDPHSPSDRADDNEGNSHPYNPVLCDTDNDGSYGSPGDTPCWSALHTHETARLDLYFSSTHPGTPALRDFTFEDMRGRETPFHRHAGPHETEGCPPGWMNPGSGGYPGSSTYCS